MAENFVTRAELDRVISEFTTHNKIIEAEALRRHESLERWRVQVQAKQDKHDKTLYGNGEPGMDEVLRNTGKSMKEIMDKMDRFIAEEQVLRSTRRAEKNQYRFLTYAAILSLVAQIGLKFIK